MKKIILFLILFFWLYQGAFADISYIPSIWEQINFNNNVSSTYDFTYTYTGTIYLDRITCHFTNTASGSADLWKISIYEGTGTVVNRLYTFERGTYTMYLWDVFTNSFRIISSQVGTSWTTAASCNFHWWYMSPSKYDGLVDLQSNTGSLYISSSSSNSSDFILSSSWSYTAMIPDGGTTLGGVMIDTRAYAMWLLILQITFLFILLLIWYLWKK